MRRYLIRLRPIIKTFHLENVWITVFSISRMKVTELNLVFRLLWNPEKKINLICHAGSERFTPSRKRRRDIDSVDLSLDNTGASSLNLTSMSQSSQWETRLLKADLIEANSKVSCECFLISVHKSQVFTT